MTATEFNAAREILGQTDDEIASALAVTPAIVRAWGSGSVAVPRRYAQHVTWLAAGVQRESALNASGLSECDWMRQAFDKLPPGDASGTLKQIEAINAHAESCAVCAARETYVNERFGPMPEMPQQGWMRIFDLAERLPPWTRPAAFSAMALAAIVSLRLLFALPALFSNPGKFGEALIAVFAAAAAGAIGGFAYTFTRPTLKRLGRPGDYLTGVVCVLAYTGALALVAPVAFGERFIEDRKDVEAFVVVSIFFGLVIGHSWFRDRSRDAPEVSP